MNTPVLLCYQLSEEKASKIRFTAMRLGIRVRRVEPGEYGLPLLALCEGEQAAPSGEAREAFSEEMLVMARFSDGQIRDFLQGLRRMKAAPVALKAILTETNGAWDSVTLHRELTMEREALQTAGKAIHQPAGNG